MKDHTEFVDLMRLVELHPAEFESMIQKQPSLLEFTGPLGETLLHYLAIEDRFAAVKTLARLGAKVDPVNEFGNTPLMECAQIDRRQMILLLSELGVDPNFKSSRGNSTPLHCAGQSGREEIYQFLLSKGADPTAKNDLGEAPPTCLNPPAKGTSQTWVLAAPVWRMTDNSSRSQPRVSAPQNSPSRRAINQPP